MGENTKIEWCDHTWNPWVGCSKVSPACDNCYAEAWAKRTGSPNLWQGERRRTTADYWRQPLMWQREAKRSGIRRKAFPSLCDPFDNQVPCPWRDDMWTRIHETPDLDWLLLTKRPQNVPKMLPDPRTGVPEWGDGWPNVWIGTTVENQEEADRRVPHLLAVSAAVRFLSCEPLLGPIDLRNLHRSENVTLDAMTGAHTGSWNVPGGWDGVGRPGWDSGAPALPGHLQPVDWVICGGESGPGARPMHPDWVRSLRDQCTAAGVPFFFKQWGAWVPHTPHAGGNLGADVRCGRVQIVHPSGRDSVSIFIDTGGRRQSEPGSSYMARVSKAKAGAELDGREWRQFPEQAPKAGGAA